MHRAEQSPAQLQDGPAVPAEVVFLAIMAALLALISLAGVPMLAEPVAGNGSDALRQGWAQSRVAQHDSAGPLLAPAGNLPTGRGREPASDH